MPATYTWTSSNPVSVGDATKVDHYDTLWENACFIKTTMNAPSTTTMLFADLAAPNAWTRYAGWTDDAMITFCASGSPGSGGSGSAVSGHAHAVGTVAGATEAAHTHVSQTTGTPTAGHNHSLAAFDTSAEGSYHTHSVSGADNHTHESVDLAIRHGHQIMDWTHMYDDDDVWLYGGSKVSLNAITPFGNYLQVGGGSSSPLRYSIADGIYYYYCNDVFTAEVEHSITGALGSALWYSGEDPDEVGISYSFHTHGVSSGTLGTDSTHTHTGAASGAPSTSHSHTISGNFATKISAYQEIIAATRD